MTRGRLLHFQCFVGDRPSGEWKAIIHDDYHAHILGRKLFGTFTIGPRMIFDTVTPTRFGYKITRQLPANF